MHSAEGVLRPSYATPASPLSLQRLETLVIVSFTPTRVLAT